MRCPGAFLVLNLDGKNPVERERQRDKERERESVFVSVWEWMLSHDSDYPDVTLQLFWLDLQLNSDNS